MKKIRSYIVIVMLLLIASSGYAFDASSLSAKILQNIEQGYGKYINVILVTKNSRTNFQSLSPDIFVYARLRNDNLFLQLLDVSEKGMKQRSNLPSSVNRIINQQSSNSSSKNTKLKVMSRRLKTYLDKQNNELKLLSTYYEQKNYTEFELNASLTRLYTSYGGMIKYLIKQQNNNSKDMGG